MAATARRDVPPRYGILRAMDVRRSFEVRAILDRPTGVMQDKGLDGREPGDSSPLMRAPLYEPPSLSPPLRALLSEPPAELR